MDQAYAKNWLTICDCAATLAAMSYKGKVDYAHQRKLRERNTTVYRLAHWPIWIWVFFLAPGPLTFSLFAHGFSRANYVWLVMVLAGTGVACYYGKLPGSEPGPYILRFDEDKPNPLYRRICYTFAWNAVITFGLLNLLGVLSAAVSNRWHVHRLYLYGYLPLCLLILLLGASGRLPRVGISTRGEGTERRFFYGAVWAVTLAQTLLMVLWRVLPQTHGANIFKMLAFVGTLIAAGFAAKHGKLARTRPILPGEEMVAD